MKSQLNNIFLVCVFFLVITPVYAGEVINVSIQELKDLIANDVQVIDVRTESEWKKTGVLEGNHLLTFYDEKGNYDLDTWLADVSKVVGKDEPVVLICHAGVRSRRIANYLAKEVGYEKVYNVKRGIARWIKEKNPTQPYQIPAE